MRTSHQYAAAAARFEEVYGGPPTLIARAPGRVNLIGEHTDYNAGFVLPFAIERELLLVARPRDDRQWKLRADNLGRRGTIAVDAPARTRSQPWRDYVAGALAALARTSYHVSGADVLITSDIPMGGGLSSSAALEMATLALAQGLGGFQLDDKTAARMGQWVENEFLGLSSGIMDQFAVQCGREDHVLCLDCRTLDARLVRVEMPEVVFVVMDTRVQRGLTDSKYNERVGECRAAVAALQARFGKGEALRDYTLPELGAAREGMSDTVFRRARHVITENARTLAACDALEQGLAITLGRLMNESDRSLREDYQVTCPELDLVTQLARSVPGCFGARMTGAGFGGCAIALVERARAEAFCRAVAAAYTASTRLEPALFVTRPQAGAGWMAWPSAAPG